MKSIIMVCGGVQEAAAVPRLKALGYRVIVIDRNPQAAAFAEADIAVNLDARDVQSLIAWVLLYKKELSIRGIFTLTNQAPTVALVAAATGLPSLPVETVMRCDNKLLMKQIFRACDLPTAEFAQVSSVEEARVAYEHLSTGTAYLKAADGFGGKGVRLVRTDRELESAYASIAGFSKFPLLILEESVSGIHIDAQGIIHGGRFHRAGAADSYFSNAEEEFKTYNPVEVLNVSPPQHPPEVLDAVYDLLEVAAQKLGVDWGAVSGDFILSDGELKIVEIAPRLHGPNGTLQIFPASTGIRPFEFMAQCVVGDTPPPEYLKPQVDRVAICRVFVSMKRSISNVGFETNPDDLPGVFRSCIYWRNGDDVSTSQSALSGLASVFVVGDTYEAAWDRLKAVEAAFEVR